MTAVTLPVLHLTGYGHMCGEVLFSTPLLRARLIQKVRAKHCGKETAEVSYVIYF